MRSRGSKLARVRTSLPALLASMQFAHVQVLLACAAASAGSGASAPASSVTLLQQPGPSSSTTWGVPAASTPVPPDGSDPTGQRDSSAALNAAIRVLCDATADSPGPRDAILDLAGGVYLLDSPLAVNSTVRCSGTLRIRSGTLLGSAALGSLGSNHSFLVTVLDYWGGLGVSLEQMVFASDSHGGGLRVDAAHHVHVSDSAFLNFATIGIWGSNLLGMGHDLAVDRCRLTECTAPMAQCADIAAKKATAILMEFPDSHFRNSVITCGRAGVVNRAGANTYHQLHIWTSCTGDAPCEAAPPACSTAQ